MNDYGRSAVEQLAYEAAFYPGTEILINKKNIRDQEELEKAERIYAERRLRQGLPNQALEFSVAGIKAIHKHILQDLYSWAGTFRTYTTGRGSRAFCTS